MRCYAKDFNNFLRVDDEGNEITPKVINKEDVKPLDKALMGETPKPDKKELMFMMDNLISSIENLPKDAMTSPVTHYDLVSALFLIRELFKAC